MKNGKLLQFFMLLYLINLQVVRLDSALGNCPFNKFK